MWRQYVGNFRDDAVVRWLEYHTQGNAKGMTLFEALDAIHPPKRLTDKPLKIPLTGVDNVGGTGTTASGRVSSGVIKPGERVTFCPAGISDVVRSIEMHHENLPEAIAGDTVVVGVHDVDHKATGRGVVVGHCDNDPPKKAKSFQAQIILTNVPNEVKAGYTPVVDCHTAHVPCKIEKILSKIDRRTGKPVEESPESLKTGDAAIVKLVPARPMCVEACRDYPALGCFVLRDPNQTIGVGVIKSVEKEA